MIFNRSLSAGWLCGALVLCFVRCNLQCNQSVTLDSRCVWQNLSLTNTMQQIACQYLVSLWSYIRVKIKISTYESTTMDSWNFEHGFSENEILFFTLSSVFARNTSHPPTHSGEQALGSIVNSKNPVQNFTIELLSAVLLLCWCKSKGAAALAMFVFFSFKLGTGTGSKLEVFNANADETTARFRTRKTFIS